MKINGNKVGNLWVRFLSKFFQVPIGAGMVDEKPLRESQCFVNSNRSSRANVISPEVMSPETLRVSRPTEKREVNRETTYHQLT